MHLPLLVPTHSEGASGSRRSWPSTRPTTPGASETSDSNLTHGCCSTSCGHHCTSHFTSHCICHCHMIQKTERTQDKKKRQTHNQGQRSPAPSPAPSASSSTKVATPLPQSHYVHLKPGYPMMAYGPDPIHAYIHPAHVQVAPSPPPPSQQPVEISRETPTRCTCQNCQQRPTTPENGNRTYHYCCCCQTEECHTEHTGYFDDTFSEGSNDAVAGAETGAGAASESSTPSYRYYQPCYLAVPFGTPFME